MSRRYEPRATGITPERRAAWRAQYLERRPALKHVRAYVAAIQAEERWQRDSYSRVARSMGRAGRPTIGKAALRREVLALIEAGEMDPDPVLLRRLKLKPARTASGIVPIAVMVKPAPCPGKCIFCPTDVRMPKSYLSNEPAGQRALTLAFDPHAQVQQRLTALTAMGHTVDKIELIVLGGTWSSYAPDYQEWFVRRMFDALNGTASRTIEEAQRRNEMAPHRNTGLVIETRPDSITVEEVRRLRWLGVTRVQIGLQSTDDCILALNKRGHTADEVRQAVDMLRGAGFKVTLHWMPNLLGATLESDRTDFQQLWVDFHPDELKIYPTGLLHGTELYEHYQRGDYEPYTEEDLTTLLADCMRTVPPYCRLNRVMRDIPAPEIVEGTTTSNLRQVVEARLREQGTPCRDIRAREVRHAHLDPSTLHLDTLTYTTRHSRELFLSMVTPHDKLAGFLRLSLPTAEPPLTELENTAVIRQVQVYGPSLAVGHTEQGAAQHQGVGTRLIRAAVDAAREAGFHKMAVIAAVGTRDYYRRFGFAIEGHYMIRSL